MDKIKRYLRVILGCLLIGITLNLFFVNTNLVPSGIFGFGVLYSQKTSMNLGLTLLLANLFFFVFGYLVLKPKTLKKMIVPFILIPVFTLLTTALPKILDMTGVDPLLQCLYGGVLLGTGFRLIYKEGFFVSGTDVVVLTTREITHTRQYIASYAFDILWLFLAYRFYGLESFLYSSIAIVIMEILSRRATLGVSDSKVFYIITKKDREIKKYIMEELQYDLTSFETKGGFLKTKNKVIMTVIPTKDYYKLKEGVKLIDPKVFISITDSYEVVNPNRHIEKK